MNILYSTHSDSNRLRIKKHILRSIFFFGGLWIIALGSVFMVQAKLGVPPWDVLHLGLSYTFGGTLGIWSILIGILIIIITYIFDHRIPKLGTLFNMVLCGIFIDTILYLHIIPTVDHLWFRSLYLIIGIILIGIGCGSYLASLYGAGPRDGLMLTLVEKTHKSIRLVRTTIEIFAVILGYFLGGPVFIGTLLFSVLIGPIIQFVVPINERTLKLLVGIISKKNTPSKLPSSI